jgi:hypothetical protein
MELYYVVLIFGDYDLGGRREDDWNCPRCGNVNSSFRKTCNMSDCT